MVALTVGMATHLDFDGVFFTIQAMRIAQDCTDVEFLVIDNSDCDVTQDFIEHWVPGGRQQARGKAVLCVDCHVLLVEGSLAKLKKYYRDNPNSKDLIQGPLWHDNLLGINTHFDPIWNDHMWGTWGNDPRGNDINGPPFDIPMQGLGLFSCHKNAWLGFNPRFRGFGGEEGYIHEKFRQAGHHCLCVPWLRWVHRFGRPFGVPFPLNVEDRIRNYFIGHDELKLNLTPIFEHFAKATPLSRVITLAREVLGDRDFSAYLPK